MVQRYKLYLRYPNYLADIFGYQTSFNNTRLCINNYLLLVLELVCYNTVADIAISKEKIVSILNYQIHTPPQIHHILNIH